jgi:hypothetical protein
VQWYHTFHAHAVRHKDGRLLPLHSVCRPMAPSSWHTLSSECACISRLWLSANVHFCRISLSRRPAGSLCPQSFVRPGVALQAQSE